jgi:hypothetical protein
MNRYIKAVLPYGMVRLVQNREQLFKQKLPKETLEVLNRNEKFRDIHRGQRCFIVGTGPSINSQDLSPLKDEIVFSLSRFYYHSLYETIRPRYQVFSGMTLHPFLFEKDGLPCDIYKEAELKIISEIIFTCIGDKQFIQENNFFQKQQIFYVAPDPDSGMKDIHVKGLDLTKSIFGFYLIPELAIQIAIFMGFREIYLLGLDHTWLYEVLHGRDFDHQFYDLKTGVLGKDNNREFISKKQDEYASFHQLISLYYHFYEDYSALKKYGENKNIKIYNATRGGMLDIFERVTLEEALER